MTTAPAFLLHGPPGVGKTCWGRMMGLARNCDHPTERPCGTCASCRGGINPLYFYEFSAARFNQIEIAEHIESLLRSAPWGNYGIFADEIHGWPPKAADIILKEVEKPRQGRYFICATTELDKVRPALRSRCIIVRFRPVQPALLFGLGQKICRNEQISYEPEALDILVDQARGSPRELVKGLEAVSRRGHLTREVVKLALSLDWTEHVIDYADALLAGDVAGEHNALKAWL